MSACGTNTFYPSTFRILLSFTSGPDSSIFVPFTSRSSHCQSQIFRNVFYSFFHSFTPLSILWSLYILVVWCYFCRSRRLSMSCFSLEVQPWRAALPVSLSLISVCCSLLCRVSEASEIGFTCHTLTVVSCRLSLPCLSVSVGADGCLFCRITAHSAACECRRRWSASH